MRLKKKLKTNIVEIKEKIDIFLNIKETDKHPLIIKELSISNLKSLLKNVQNIFNSINVDLIEFEDNKIAFRKLKKMLKNIISGAIPYYEYIVSGKHSFYKKRRV